MEELIEYPTFKQENVIPYIYGTLAFSTGKRGEAYTHRWICYVRGLYNEDLSYLIDKVQFTLHSSFQNPVREVTTAPFEIQQVGWGQFQIGIKIYFKHPTLPPVQVSHLLKLHHAHLTGPQQHRKPLCSQVYDEIVFTQMDEHLQNILKSKEDKRQLQIQIQNQETDANSFDQPLKSIMYYTHLLTTTQQKDHRLKLQQALRFINGQISNLELKMQTIDIQHQNLYQDLVSRSTL